MSYQDDIIRIAIVLNVPYEEIKNEVANACQEISGRNCYLPSVVLSEIYMRVCGGELLPCILEDLRRQY